MQAEPEYIIVGQGAAGSLLAWFLHAAGKNIQVYEHTNPHASSEVAAGIMNPITGRTFVKSWLYDQLQPFAHQCYQDIQQALGADFYSPFPLVRALPDIKTENDWMAKSAAPEYAGYLNQQALSEQQLASLQGLQAYISLHKSGRCDLKAFKQAMKQWLLSQGLLHESRFDYNKALQSKSKIIFCEGFQVLDNPYFSYLPLQPSKGEVLIVEMPDYQLSGYMVKHDVFIVPLGKQQYWVGSNYDNQFETLAPTETMRTDLVNRLQAAVNHPFTILEHRAGIRPAVRGRKPLLGQHPVHKNLYIFNGLGTKGATLGPYMAKHMTQYLTDAQALMPEVDIQRFAEFLGPQ
jgi:glycine/D-amino acid oxidase-like deaminating enzyme